MAVVELRLPPSALHVRTARLVAVAAARRAGLAVEAVDELRQAVGEACSLAVSLHAQEGCEAPVLVLVDDDESALTVHVVSEVRAPEQAPDLAQALLRDDPDDGQIALAFLPGLVEDLDIRHEEQGTRFTMRWPLRRVPAR